MSELSETEFWDAYRPMAGPTGQSGEHLWEFEEVRHEPLHHVWTVVESGDDDDENWYALPGFHIVNRIAYVRTEIPWEDEGLTAVYFEDDFDRDEPIEEEPS